MQRLSILALLVGWTAACPPPGDGACTTSADCPRGQTCIERRCSGSVGGGSADGADSGAAGGNAGGRAGGGPTEQPGERCEVALPLEQPGIVPGSTAEARPDVQLDCTGVPLRGPDVVYVVTVPPGQRLGATLTARPADGGLSWDPALLLVAGPAANCTGDGGPAACLSGSDTERVTERVAWTNASPAPREVFLIVDSLLDTPHPVTGAPPGGPFELSLSLAPPPDGDRCETALPVTPGTLTGQTLRGFTRDVQPGPGCRRSDGPERAYTLTVPPGQRLSAIARPAPDGGTADLALNLVAQEVAACSGPDVRCLAGVNAQPLGLPEQLDWVNRDASPKNVLLLVSAASADDADADFSLTLTLSSSPLGDDCQNAQPLPAGQALTGQSLTGFGHDYALGMNCANPSAGPDRLFEVMVPAGKVLSVTVTPAPTLDTSVSLVAGPQACLPGAAVCLVGGDGAGPGAPDIVRWTNRSQAATSVLVLVDSAAGQSGTFDLLASLSDPPPGEACFNATPLSVGATLGGTTAGYANDYVSSATSSCARTGTLNADRVYGFQVPAGERARLTLSPDGGFSPSLSVVTGESDACEVEPRACVASSGASSSTRTVSFFNPGPGAAGAFAIVDSSSAAGGSFSLSLTTGVPPRDDLCSTAVTAVPQGGLSGQTLHGPGLAFERDYDCVPLSSGPDRVYVGQAPPGQRFSVTVTPTFDGGFDPVLSLIQGPASACDGAARRCLASSDAAGRGRPESATITNGTSQPQPVFIVVGSYSPADVNTGFSLSTATSPLSPGEVCENAEALTPGATLTNQSLASYLREYTLTGPGCRPSSGADRVYVVSVGPNQRLTARVVPDLGSDAVLNLLEGPSSRCTTSADCLASADRGGAGADETLTWRNPGTSTASVFLVVSRYSAGPMTFALDVTLQ